MEQQTSAAKKVVPVAPRNTTTTTTTISDGKEQVSASSSSSLKGNETQHSKVVDESDAVIVRTKSNAPLTSTTTTAASRGVVTTVNVPSTTKRPRLPPNRNERPPSTSTDVVVEMTKVTSNSEIAIAAEEKPPTTTTTTTITATRNNSQNSVPTTATTTNRSSSNSNSETIHTTTAKQQQPLPVVSAVLSTATSVEASKEQQQQQHPSAPPPHHTHATPYSPPPYHHYYPHPPPLPYYYGYTAAHHTSPPSYYPTSQSHPHPHPQHHHHPPHVQPESKTESNQDVKVVAGTGTGTGAGAGDSKQSNNEGTRNDTSTTTTTTSTTDDILPNAASTLSSSVPLTIAATTSATIKKTNTTITKAEATMATSDPNIAVKHNDGTIAPAIVLVIPPRPTATLLTKQKKTNTVVHKRKSPPQLLPLSILPTTTTSLIGTQNKETTVNSKPTLLSLSSNPTILPRQPRQPPSHPKHSSNRTDNDDNNNNNNNNNNNCVNNVDTDQPPIISQPNPTQPQSQHDVSVASFSEIRIAPPSAAADAVAVSTLKNDNPVSVVKLPQLPLPPPQQQNSASCPTTPTKCSNVGYKRSISETTAITDTPIISNKTHTSTATTTTMKGNKMPRTMTDRTFEDRNVNATVPNRVTKNDVPQKVMNGRATYRTSTKNQHALKTSLPKTNRLPLVCTVSKPVVKVDQLTYDWSSLELDGTKKWNQVLQRQTPITNDDTTNPNEERKPVTAIHTYMLMQRLKESLLDTIVEPHPDSSLRHVNAVETTQDNSSLSGKSKGEEQHQISPPNDCPEELRPLYANAATLYKSLLEDRKQYRHQQEQEQQQQPPPQNQTVACRRQQLVSLREMYQFMTANEIRQCVQQTKNEVLALSRKEKQILHSAERLFLYPPNRQPSPVPRKGMRDDDEIRLRYRNHFRPRRRQRKEQIGTVESTTQSVLPSTNNDVPPVVGNSTVKVVRPTVLWQDDDITTLWKKH